MKRIAITMGEPAGIGPDIILQTAQHTCLAELVVFADPTLLEERAKQLNLPLTLKTFDPNHVRPHQTGQLSIVPINLREKCIPGKLSTANSITVLNSIEQAVQACVNHHCDAILTPPVQKGIINNAGFTFTGHTEFLATLCGVKTVVMLFVSPDLKVALQTTHLPLKDVPNKISIEKIMATTKLIDQDLKRLFHIAKPKIAICGLNPHAGENGHMGDEEIKIINPAIEQLKNQGIDVSGPHAADTIFHEMHRHQYDVILAMYHDQGLTPFKTLYPHKGVNVSLGLPLIRTSVDHGVALTLAGTGKANCASFAYALELTQKLINDKNFRRSRVGGNPGRYDL